MASVRSHSKQRSQGQNRVDPWLSAVLHPLTGLSPPTGRMPLALREHCIRQWDPRGEPQCACYPLPLLPSIPALQSASADQRPQPSVPFPGLNRRLPQAHPLPSLKKRAVAASLPGQDAPPPGSSPCLPQTSQAAPSALRTLGQGRRRVRCSGGGRLQARPALPPFPREQGRTPILASGPASGDPHSAPLPPASGLRPAEAHGPPGRAALRPAGPLPPLTKCQPLC